MKKIKIYHKEEWKKIYYNGEKTKYSVSNKGRVKNRKTDKILKPSLTNKGYYNVHLSIDGDAITTLVHRLVAMAFIENPEDKAFVNHKDGCKTNNKVSNLEWATPSENVIHSYQVLGNRTGEDSNFNVYPEEFIRQICELLQDGHTNKEIREMLGLEDRKYLLLIDHIAHGERWVNVSRDYNFPKHVVETRGIDRYDEDEVRQICELIQEGKTNAEIAKLMGKDGDIKFKNVVYTIAHGKAWTEISKEYNFPKKEKKNSTEYTEEHVRFICEKIVEGLSNKEIALKLMEKYKEFEELGTVKIGKQICKIRNKQRWTNISEEYNF